MNQNYYNVWYLGPLTRGCEYNHGETQYSQFITVNGHTRCRYGHEWWFYVVDISINKNRVHIPEELEPFNLQKTEQMCLHTTCSYVLPVPSSYLRYYKRPFMLTLQPPHGSSVSARWGKSNNWMKTIPRV